MSCELTIKNVQALQIYFEQTSPMQSKADYSKLDKSKRTLELFLFTFPDNKCQGEFSLNPKFCLTEKDPDGNIAMKRSEQDPPQLDPDGDTIMKGTEARRVWRDKDGDVIMDPEVGSVCGSQFSGSDSFASQLSGLTSLIYQSPSALSPNIFPDLFEGCDFPPNQNENQFIQEVPPLHLLDDFALPPNQNEALFNKGASSSPNSTDASSLLSKDIILLSEDLSKDIKSTEEFLDSQENHLSNEITQNVEWELKLHSSAIQEFQKQIRSTIEQFIQGDRMVSRTNLYSSSSN